MEADMESSIEQANEEFLPCEKRLLPEIPNEITMALISVKLTWRTLGILSSVSRAWNREVRRRENDRVRTLATETTALITYNYRSFTIHSMAGDGFSCKIPGIPPLDRVAGWKAIHCGWKALLVDGRVYAVGEKRADLFVMDLAVERRWKQRKSMEYHAGYYYCLCFLRGKIYVSSSIDNTSILQAYDPESDTWDVNCRDDILNDPETYPWDLMVPGLNDAMLAQLRGNRTS